MLRGGIFEIDREQLKEIGEKCVMRSCMMCSEGDEMGWACGMYWGWEKINSCGWVWLVKPHE